MDAALQFVPTYSEHLGEYCHNVDFCTLQQFKNPVIELEHSFWPYAQWFSAFLVFYFTHSWATSVAWMSIWKFLHYILIAAVFMMNTDLGFETWLFRFSLQSDFYEVFNTFSGLFTGILAASIIKSPELTLDPYTQRSRINETYGRIAVSSQLLQFTQYKLPSNVKWDIKVNVIKNYLYLLAMEYVISVIEVIKGFMRYLHLPGYSGGSVLVDLSIYLILQFILWLLYFPIGQLTQIDREAIWRFKDNRFRDFMIMWLVCAGFMAAPIYLVPLSPTYTVVFSSFALNAILLGIFIAQWLFGARGSNKVKSI